MPGSFRITNATARIVAETLDDGVRGSAIAQRLLQVRPFAIYVTLIVSEVVNWILTLLTAGSLTAWLFDKHSYRGIALFIILIVIAILMTSLTKRIRKWIFLSLHKQARLQ